MASVCFNHKSSFPALPEKQALILGIRTFPQFTKKLKQVRFLSGNHQGTSWQQKYRYVISMIFFSGFLEMIYVNSVTYSDLDHCFDTDLILHL